MTERSSLSVSSQDAENRLEGAFADASHGGDHGDEPLRDAICAYVDAMKAEGRPVERVIIGVKKVAIRARLSSRRYLSVFSEFRDVSEDRIARAVRWCIEQYYLEPNTGY